MKTRKLGDLEISEMGFGCMSLSANFGPATDRTLAINVIRNANKKGAPFLTRQRSSRRR